MISATGRKKAEYRNRPSEGHACWESVQLKETVSAQALSCPFGAEAKLEKGPTHLKTDHRSSRKQTFPSPFLEQGRRGLETDQEPQSAPTQSVTRTPASPGTTIAQL